jgi:hypothetical protein
MQSFRQGDVILTKVKKFTGKQLSHLTLAEGEVTGHSHRVINGQAELYEQDGVLYLVVLSRTATLSHEEHHTLHIPQGTWMVRIQREYVPQRRQAPVALPATRYDSDLWESFIHQAPQKQSLCSHPSAFKSSNREEWNNLISEIEALSEEELLVSIWDSPEQLARQFVNYSTRQFTPNNKRFIKSLSPAYFEP